MTNANNTNPTTSKEKHVARGLHQTEHLIPSHQEITKKKKKMEDDLETDRNWKQQKKECLNQTVEYSLRFGILKKEVH